MNTWKLIIGLYLISVIALGLYLLRKKASQNITGNKQERIFAAIALLFAPFVWIIGLCISLGNKAKKGEEQPRPLPKKLQGSFKKDTVLFQNRTMSIAEVNRITGKDYTLKQIYGKKYVSAITEEDRNQFDDGESDIFVDDNVRQDDSEYPIIFRFANARMRGNLESVHDLFSSDVTLVVYGQETRFGVDSVLEFWQKRYDTSITRQVKFDFNIVPCMLYNGIAIEEVPERFARMLITFRFKNGMISGMCLAPEYLNPKYEYYGGFREAPNTEEFFRRYIKSDLEPKTNRIPCHNCGTLSENLEWYSFDNNDYDYFYGYKGIVSVCPHCNRTVEIYPIERYDIPEEKRRQNIDDLEDVDQKEYQNRVPDVKASLFWYTTPLAGTEFVEDLDDTKKISLMTPISGPEGKPRTAKECAEEFHSLLIGQIARYDKTTFDRIVDSYLKAFLQGNLEAGNNLGILYLNYADMAEDGILYFQTCAKRGNANAIANCFSALWNEKDGHKKAIKFALSVPAKPCSLCWNLAVLYLRGQEIEGSPLNSDKVKAKDYLRMVIDGTSLPVGDSHDTDIWKRRAEELLPAIDGFEVLSDIARDYVNIAIPYCIKSAEKGEIRYGLEYELHKRLRHFNVPEDTSLHLCLASQEHNDHGDISRFLLLDGDKNIVCDENDIIYRLWVERSIYGAWDVYLFSKAANLLPTWWHGGYNRETLLFSHADLAAIPSQKGKALEVITNGDDLKPHVSLLGNKATVECCFWSEWGGLYREEVTITFDGNRVTTFEKTASRNIYNYDCGIMF